MVAFLYLDTTRVLNEEFRSILTDIFDIFFPGLLTLPEMLQFEGTDYSRSVVQLKDRC